jgi:hypothetical protein
MDEDVGQFEVSVDDAGGMQIKQPLGHLGKNNSAEIFAKPPSLGLYQLAYVTSIAILCEDIVGLVCLITLVKADYVRAFDRLEAEDLIFN